MGYKAWRLFKQKDDLDILPPLRAIFSIIFLYGLFKKIICFAKEKGYEQNYSPLLLYLGFLFMFLLSRLPDPFWLLEFFFFVFFIPPFLALNYAKLNSEDLIVIEQNSFSGRQWAIIVIGSILMILSLLFFVEEGVVL